MEEAELVRRMAADDLEALEELMRRTQRELFRLAYLISGNYADCEDIVQETFVQAYLKRKTIREPEYFKTWLIRMMTRIAWRYLKKKGREKPSEEVFHDRGSENGQAGAVQMAGAAWDTVFEAVEEREEARELYEAIRRLPVKQRTVVVLYYFEEMTTKEIAAAAGCLEGTVKSRLHTARKRLKQELSGSDLPEEGRVSV